MNSFPNRLTAKDVAERLNELDVLVVEVLNVKSNDSVFIPSAAHMEPAALISGIPPASGRLPDVRQLEMAFGQIGYDPNFTIIVCDDEGGGWAGRLAWTLDVIGHEKWHYLDGGLHAWIQAGYVLQPNAARPRPTQPKFSLNLGPVAEAEDIMSNLGDEDLVIWDCRSREEFLGLRPTAQRNGHIPGAVNLDWLDLMDRNRSLALREDIETLLTDSGITRDKNVITHCQTHHRSGLTYMTARLLGFPSIRAYHGSWSEWGNRSDTPIETDAG